jgi:hypothetical protein
MGTKYVISLGGQKTQTCHTHKKTVFLKPLERPVGKSVMNRATLDVYFKNHTAYINIVCGKNSDMWDVNLVVYVVTTRLRRIGDKFEMICTKNFLCLF